MGLFSFIKRAGRREADEKARLEAENAAFREEMARAEANAERQKTILYKGIIGSLGIPIRDLSVDIEGDIIKVYGETDTMSDKEKIILSLGNIEGVEKIDDRISVVNPEPPSRTYVVKKGDSLSKIAKAHYGDAMAYMKIFEANSPPLKDPNLIYPGQVLRIPA